MKKLVSDVRADSVGVPAGASEFLHLKLTAGLPKDDG
jgi:hypothetical protein